MHNLPRASTFFEVFGCINFSSIISIIIAVKIIMVEMLHVKYEFTRMNILLIDFLITKGFYNENNILYNDVIVIFSRRVTFPRRCA